MDCKTIISLAASNRHHAILGTIRVEYTPDGRIASVSATDTETTIVLSRAGSSGKVAMALFPPDKRFAPDTARVETAKDGPRLMLGGSRLLPVDDTKEEYPPPSRPPHPYRNHRHRRLAAGRLPCRVRCSPGR